VAIRIGWPVPPVTGPVTVAPFPFACEAGGDEWADSRPDPERLRALDDLEADGAGADHPERASEESARLRVALLVPLAALEIGSAIGDVTVEGEQEIVDRIENEYASYMYNFSRLGDLLKNETRARSFYHQEMVAAYQAIYDACRDLRNINQVAMERAAEKARIISVKAILSMFMIGLSVVIIGIGFSLVFQAMINMAVAVHLFPVTGQTLPLISMGGTSIWFTCISIGIILSVSRKCEIETRDGTEVEVLSEGNPVPATI